MVTTKVAGPHRWRHLRHRKQRPSSLRRQSLTLLQSRLLFRPAMQRGTTRAKKKAKATEKDMERINAMRKITIGIAALSLVLVLGCKKQESTSEYNNSSSNTVASQQATTNLSPEDLGKLGAEIKKNPKDADKILSAKGLTQEQFEQAVRKVAESPSDSKKYADAYKKAS